MVKHKVEALDNTVQVCKGTRYYTTRREDSVGLLIKNIEGWVDKASLTHKFVVTLSGDVKISVTITQESFLNHPFASDKDFIIFTLQKRLTEGFSNKISEELFEFEYKISNSADKPVAKPVPLPSVASYMKKDEVYTSKYQAFKAGIVGGGKSNVIPINSKKTTGIGQLTNYIPALATFKTSCPEPTCNLAGVVLQSLIIHLNDDHKWARERIADWLDTLDADLEFKGEKIEGN